MPYTLKPALTTSKPTLKALITSPCLLFGKEFVPGDEVHDKYALAALISGAGKDASLSPYAYNTSELPPLTVTVDGLKNVEAVIGSGLPGLNYTKSFGGPAEISFDVAADGMCSPFKAGDCIKVTEPSVGTVHAVISHMLTKCTGDAYVTTVTATVIKEPEAVNKNPFHKFQPKKKQTASLPVKNPLPGHTYDVRVGSAMFHRLKKAEVLNGVGFRLCGLYVRCVGVPQPPSGMPPKYITLEVLSETPSGVLCPTFDYDMSYFGSNLGGLPIYYEQALTPHNDVQIDTVYNEFTLVEDTCNPGLKIAEDKGNGIVRGDDILF